MAGKKELHDDDSTTCEDGVLKKQQRDVSIENKNINRNSLRSKMRLFSVSLCVGALVYSCCFHHDGNHGGHGGHGMGGGHHHHHGGGMMSMSKTMMMTTNNDQSETTSPETTSFTTTTFLQKQEEERQRRDNDRRLGRSLLLSDNETEQELVDQIALKLKPTTLQFQDEKVPKAIKNTFGLTTGYSETEVQVALKPHQFLHLHHMKTGGTSVDHMLRCAMKRLETEANYFVPYYSIHECSRTSFAKCLTNSSYPCRSRMDDAAIMSYCSALKYLDTFGWWNSGNDVQSFPESNDRIKAFTVLRHPVDRVWSMFRFQTKNCYKCTNLTEIYDLIDQNKTEGFDALCLAQLQNHEVANLLSSDWAGYTGEGGFVTQIEFPEIAETAVAEAITNMKSFFTVIGLTEEILETARILGVVFPWLNTTIEVDVDVVVEDENGNNITKTVKETAKTACPIPHSNASPSNNRCVGEGKTASHWEQQQHPDDATREAIEKHNAMDMKLYEAAVQYFELQRRAIESGEDSSRR